MTLAEKINEELKEAMRSRNQARLDTLRMLKSKILAADARGQLSDTEVVKLFKTYYGNLKEAFEQAKAANRTDISEKLETELKIIQEFLPKAPSAEETRQIILQAIEETGAKSKKDLGLVMKAAKNLNQAIDGQLASSLANELLS